MFTTFAQQSANQQQAAALSLQALLRTEAVSMEDSSPDGEAFSCWEDQLDLLGSEPDLAKLRALLDDAPCTENDLYAFAMKHYRERLPAAMQDWEDTLDAMGVWCDLEALEVMLARCPDPDHASALFLAGVITQRVLAG